MCWCWSEKPQQRPTCEEVLTVMETDSFMHLVKATPVTTENNEFTAACINSLSQDDPKGTTRSLSSSAEHDYVHVLYGTINGSCGVVIFDDEISVKVSTLLLKQL